MGILKHVSAPKPEAVGVVNISRRRFLQGSTGLVLGLYLAPLTLNGSRAEAEEGAEADFEPNAFVRITADGTVIVLAKHLEMGQGTYTGLATLVAEELDADWSRVRVEGAPADAERYKNLAFGLQGTGGSTAIANSYEQMRTAGATARAMLVAAAAERWGVAAESISVSQGVVRHRESGREAGFGELAEAAAELPVPQEVTLKDPEDFTLIGTLNTPRTDSAGKTDGSAMFTQDMKLPGMLIAVAAHPRRFGARVASFDDTKAREVPGVVEVVPFAGGPHRFEGVAVLAENTWAASQGRNALEIEWDDSQAFSLGSEEIMARYRELAEEEGAIAARHGDVVSALSEPATLIEADYEFPYLAHAAMEPMNCLVELGDERCDIWNGEQWQTMDQQLVAELLGIAPENVSLTQLYAGGSFGRRANPYSDFVLEAVSIAMAAREQGIEAPVKLVWMREDDTRGGYYRPMNFHRGRLALDADGQLIAWHQRLVGQSILQGTALESFLVQDGIDATSVEGAANLAYDVPNLQVELHTPEDIGVPVQWWRAVGHTHTAFSTECLIDEAAVAAEQDPVAFRRALLSQHPRHRGVLDLVAEKAGWEQPLAPGSDGQRRGRGVAVHESFNSFVAQVAEVTVEEDGSYRVDRVVCAVDCGVAVNPDVIKAQMEGGIGFGLAAALHGEITLEEGVVQQSNFHDYEVLRINEMPAVEVHIVPSTEAPTGVGEPGVPPIAPAVANALFDASGERLRRMPFAQRLPV
ncbi:xanthine dehydrogenase family protein molybdopterin-binding subunit [Halomonas sp. MCCC 1A11057]|jgi:isoquinoline 1-oxidoreductase beta subunit|uniref:xanthine dehydrogenase family protein molybdopterin-binding subunit n=1 Tax=Halomonas sp. MCCC 1A11057 TaxID=2733482 RepID=UPI001F1DD165|nr:xanthine dehydrogenase family protein molybdopterin-binding subunit [Halomonas sp. MCCC 1A11057]MCE8034875.1 xanthine dehydrogenase family protein molybdopterin-binding subunit [Halomonas sp. MCCC 1A11057]